MVLSAAQQQAVRNHLEEVVASPVFGNSARRAQLLRYLVEKTLAGEEIQISEYAIGVDVLGRPKTFDPRTESIVRTEMTRLRQKLKEYYSQTGSGPIVIELPLRSYVPVFVFQQSSGNRSLTVAAQQRFWRSPRWVAAAVVLCGVAWAVWSVWPAHRAVFLTTTNQQAHDLYLKASSAGARATPEAYRQAIALFRMLCKRTRVIRRLTSAWPKMSRG